MQNKKGQVAWGIIVTFTIFILMIALGAVIIQDSRNSLVTTSTFNVLDEQEASVLTNVSETLDINTAGNAELSIITTQFIAENSTGALLGTGNYTITAAGVFTLISTDFNNSANLNFTYNYTGKSLSAAGNLSAQGLVAAQQAGSMSTTVGLVIVAGIIVSLVGLIIAATSRFMQ